MEFNWLSDPQAWVALGTLTLLEIVLGIDNIVFISILAGKLPPAQRSKARRLGLTLALITRVLLLMGLSWMMGLTKALFVIGPFWGMDEGHPVAGRDLILMAGGLFLLGKATYEIHEKLEGEDGESSRKVPPKFASVILQILLLDVVFSLDSVITAVGMVRIIAIMVIAVVLAMVFMWIFINTISDFVERHPTIKMLALSFLILIGCMLVAEGFHKEIPKGYIYFAMAFAVGVEILNMRVRKRGKKVRLHQAYR